MKEDKFFQKIHRVSLGNILKMIHRRLRIISGLFLTMSVACYVIVGNGMLIPIMQFQSIYWFGIVLSYGVHEYLHGMFLKKEGAIEVWLYTGLFKFSVCSFECMSAKSKILVALSGPLCCMMLGILIYILSLICNGSMTLYIISAIYFMHGINLLPIFGDGKVLLRALFQLKK